ncbi:MAG: hypothetical protein V4526_02705 [Patescibacteria group bacterium]
MIPNKKFQGGYIGLISLLVTVALIGFMAIYMYGPHSKTGGRETGLENDSRGAGAIEQADAVKNALESRNSATVESDR